MSDVLVANNSTKIIQKYSKGFIFLLKETIFLLGGGEVMKEVRQKLRQEFQWFHTGSVPCGASSKLRNRTAGNSDMPTQVRCSERKMRQALSEYIGKI